MSVRAALLAAMSAAAPLNAYEVITAQALTSGCEGCWDAGYSSTTQFDDLTGNSNHLIADVAANFQGVQNNKSANEYFLCDGTTTGFTIGANTTSMNNAHKDGAQHSWFAIFYPVSLAASTGFLLGTVATATDNNGILASVTASATPANRVVNEIFRKAGSSALTKTTTAAITDSAWNFLGSSQDENGGASGLNLQINASAEASNGNLTTPSSTNGTAFSFGRYGAHFAPNNWRLRAAAWWSTPIGGTALTSLRNAYVSAGNFGL